MTDEYGLPNGPLDADRARASLERAAELADGGDYAAAAAIYQRVTGNPSPIVHVAALLGLADARYRLDDEEGALQAWLAATQAPETPLSWRAWVALAGVRVRQGDLAGAARAYREAERRSPPDERAAIAARLGWLNKEMGNTGTAQRYFGRARAGYGFRPLATWTILAITVGISLSALFVPGTAELADRFLPLDKQAVMAGEWWRLLTVTLIHGSILHLGFNMYALYIVGPFVELIYGRVLFILFYLLAALGGSLASYLIFPNPSVGASGAIFGLFGLLAVSNYVHKPALGPRGGALTRQIVFLIVINVAIGFTLPRIDNAAHLGGLATGAWLGLAVVPRGAATLSDFWRRVPTPGAPEVRRTGLHPVLQVAGLLLLAAVLLIAVSVEPFWLGGGR